MNLFGEASMPLLGSDDVSAFRDVICVGQLTGSSRAGVVRCDASAVRRACEGGDCCRLSRCSSSLEDVDL